MREPAPGAPIARPMKSGYVVGALVVSAVLVLGLGVWPQRSLQAATSAKLLASGR